MKISTNTAMKLVESLGRIVNNSLGIIDLNGMFLAHSNQRLTGSYSHAAIKLLDEGKMMSYVPESSQNSLELPGIYLAITVNRQVCGVLLVQYGTQSFDELLQTAELIRRICAHTIIESVSTNYYNIRDYDKKIFLADWLKGIYSDDRPGFSKRASEYGIKTEAGCTAAILKIYHIAFNRTLYFDVFDTLVNLGYYVVADENDFILIFNTMDRVLIKSHIERIAEYLTDKSPNHLLAVGSPQRNCSRLRASYDIAKLMQTLYFGKKTGTLFYDNCILDICLSEVPQAYKDSFLSRVFANCAQKDIADYCSFIYTYIESNGSLKEMSEKLFAHKNTIQYRIERIKSKTGLDLRVYFDAFQLYIAAVWASQTLHFASLGGQLSVSQESSGFEDTDTVGKV